MNGSGAFLATLQVEHEVIAQIQNEQANDEYLQIVRHELEENGSENFSILDDRLHKFKGRVCVPAKEEVRCQLLTEAQEHL